MESKEYAGFWIRSGAMIIDAIIFYIVVLVPLGFIYGEGYWGGDKFVYGFWDLILSYVFPAVATIWFWLRFFATPGKMATRLEVVDAKTGDKISVGQAIGRYLSYVLSALPMGLGFIWIGIDKRKQGWHDKLAGTLVLRNTEKETVKFEGRV